jgi:ammonium transporter
MFLRWSLLIAFLFVWTAVPSTRAVAQPPKAEEAPAPRDTLQELKTGLEATQAELAATKKALAEQKGGVDAAATTGRERGDTAWMLMASALVLLMVPGLALFYGGMVRRKNVLATMMQSMAALAVVGVYWVLIGYALAFGPSVVKVSFLGAENGGLFGWSNKLLFLKGVAFDEKLPGADITVYLHMLFQGMFAIITPALISGAVAERIRFLPFCLFMLLWVTFVYCPLAHMVWAFDWFDPEVLLANRGKNPIGLLGKMGALDFAGGTVVHIAAGLAGLACCLVLGKRLGYPQQVAHPNGMVLTLLGAGLLWFGWFGFNGGSAGNATPLAVSAFAATQVAAAAAGLAWLLIEWGHKGKPTALGLASGVVAGLVAVTPASGFVYVWGAFFIGLAATCVCYVAVALKSKLGYDDSLDAFGVHGVGGFVGAVLTGVFCSALINGGADGPFAYSAHRARLEALKKDDGAVIKEAAGASEKATKAADAQEKESKIEELTDAVAKAQDKFDKAPAEAKPPAEEALKAAKDKLKIAADAVQPLKDVAADKAAAQKALEDELAALQTLADKQDDKEHDGKDKKSAFSQVFIQLKAAVFAVVFAFVLSLVLVYLTQALTLGTFKTDEKSEAVGLDRTEHDEVGFDFSAATESVPAVATQPRAATAPRGNGRFEVKLTGADTKELMAVWSDLCQPTPEGTPDADFLAVYPHVTTVRGTTFRCRGGDPTEVAKHLGALFTRHTGKTVSATVPEAVH